MDQTREMDPSLFVPQRDDQDQFESSDSLPCLGGLLRSLLNSFVSLGSMP